jgi:translocation and assembly module TamA
VGLKRPGRVAWAGVALAALVVLLLAVIHTAPVVRRVREWVVAQVASAWRLDLQASSLDYNLFTRRVSLSDVRLSAPGHDRQPFFVARRVSASLPWAVFLGTVRISSLEVDDGVVRLVREGGVIVNLPPSSGLPPPAVPRRLDLRGLVIRNLDVEYVDRTGDIDVTVRGLQAALTERDVRIFSGASGTITAASIAARVAANATTSGPVEGRLAFDGSNLSLQQLTAPFREGTVVADGRINRALDDTSFALTLAGTVDMAALSAWTPPPVPVSGAGTFTGTMDGPLGGYTIAATFAVPSLTIARAGGLPLEGALTITSARAVVDRFRIVAPGQRRAADRPGTIEGRFTYTFGPDGPLELTTTWRDVDLDLAMAAYDREPLVFAAWQDGSLTLTRAGPLAPLAMTASGRSAALPRRDRIAATGTWNAVLDRERWVVGHDHEMLDGVRASGTLRWPFIDDSAAAMLTGPLTVQVADVGRTAVAARRSGIDVSTSLDEVHGPVTLALDVAGSIEVARVEGHAESPALVLPTGATGTASADLVLDTETALVPRFELRAQGSALTGDARVELASGRLTGAFAGDVESLPAFASPWLGDDAAALSGTMRLTGTLGGTTEVPDVPWRLESTPLAHGELPIGVVAAEGRLLGTTVQIARLQIEQNPGRLEGSGEYDYESGAYTAAIGGTGLRIGQPFVGSAVEAVVVDLQYEGAGTLDAPGGQGTMRIVPEGGHVAELVGAANVRWQFAAGRVEARIFVPRLRALVDASVAPSAPYDVRGTVVVNRLDIEPLALAAGALDETIAGTVSLSATFQGQAATPESLSAFVNLQEVAVIASGIPLRLERPAHITASADDFSVDDLYLHVGSGLLTASGRLRDPVQAPLSVWYGGPVGDLVAMAGTFGIATGVQASGDLNAWWESTGGLDNAYATATIRNGRVAWPDVPAIEGLEVDAAFDGATVVVERVQATWQGGGIEGKARIPRGLLMATAGPPAPPGRVDLTVRGLTHEALRPWLPAQTINSLDARVSATLALDLASADIDGITGTLVLDEATVTAAGVPISQAHPARMSIAKGVLRFDDVAFSAGQPVVVGGSVAVGDATTLDLTLSGTPGLRPLSVLSPQMSVDGIATLDLRITGTTAAPRINGRVDLEAVEAVLRNPRVIASDIAGPIVFDGDRVVMSGLSGSLNGGTLDASGTFTFAGVDVVGGELTFQARGVAIEYPDDVNSEIDALLVFLPGPGAPLLRGDVRVLRGSYRATISLPALVAFNRAAVAPQQQPSYLDTVRLDVAVSTEDDLLVDNNYGRFEAGADLRLQGTVARPGVTGRAELREGGEMFVLGGLYQLNESSVSFTNPTAIEPDLNISMATRSSGYDTTLTISGTLDRLETDVTSSDPDADQTVMSVLLGGNSLSREDALALFSGELLGVTGRAIGLDSLRVERGFDTDLVRQDPGLIAEDIDPSTRLTLSKRLRANVEVILSQDLRASGGLSAVINYRPLRSIELRAISRDNTDRAVTIRHEISFGGARVAPPRRRVSAKVADVRFDGAGADEAALRDRLRVSPGDTFDFGAWQDDVDRLEQWYHERGRLEARVRGSRTNAADGRVDLLYRITPGPVTELRVSGTELPDRLRRQLETAWSASVFDRFLVDEVQRHVALDLVRRNVIGAVVEASVPEATADRKVLQVDVRGGTPVARKEVRYQGTRAVSPGALEALVTAYYLDEWIWIEPSVVVDPFIEHYALAGYRAVQILPEPVRFEGDAALVVVNIVEGPVTRLTEVRYDGVEPSLETAVADAGRMPGGEIYRDEDVDIARRQIEALYRRLGYNDAVVTPKVVLDDTTHTASVAFAVEPGREQRLAGVVVQGTVRSRPESVVRALGLKPGAPVDYAQWAQARKRVFDTNVFRQVEVTPEEVPGAAGGPEQVNARVTVTEWPTWRLRYGLQLNDRDQSDLGRSRSQDLGLVADIQNRNVFGRGFTFGLYGRVERRLYSNSTYLTFPTFFGRAVQTNVFGSRSRQDQLLEGSTEPDFLDRREVASIEQRIRRTRTFEITYGYRLTNRVLDAVDPDDPFLNETLIGRFTSAALLDRRDDPFDATRGWFASATAERVSEFRGGSDSIKLLGAFYAYRALGQVILASAVRIGGSFLDPLVFSEPFLTGGSRTVRGYAEEAVGPRNVGGRPLGGNAQLILNQEVRAPIRGWLKGVAFVDAGNVFASNRDISFTDLKVGYGVGLRLDTPFSLLRVDLGIPASGGARRWYFGIGQVF